MFMGQQIEALSKSINWYSSTHKNFNFLSDFNAGTEMIALKNPGNLYCLISLISNPA